jgi:ABC-2 type transport system permease protein
MTTLVNRAGEDGEPPPGTEGMQPPSSTSGLLEVFRRRYLLRVLVKRELSARYQGSFLGMVWSYIQPLVRFLLYYFVIGQIIGMGDVVENFAVHVFTAMVFVNYFTESFTAGTRSIVRNSSIIKKMAVPREMFPTASMIVSAYHTIPGMVILVGAILIVGWSPDPVGFAAGLLGFLIFTVLGTALALLFSAANVFARDFSNVVQTLNQFVQFSVPMIYPFSLVQDKFADFAPYYLLNPLAEAVLLMQRCFWVTTTDDPAASVVTEMPDHLFAIGFAHLGGALVVLVIAQLVFIRLEKKFPERL